MQDRITVPKRVEEAIGYGGWTALSWALHNGWVQDYKWYLSEINKRDIGTPFTVRMMLDFAGLMAATNQFYTFSEEADRPEGERVGTRGLFMFSDRVEPQKAPEFYRLMVEGYLFGTDFVSPLRRGVVPDEHGANQLEGELRRHWANKNELIQPREVGLTRVVIDDYCATYGLNGASERFAERLKL